MDAFKGNFVRPPVSLRRSLDVDDLCRDNPCARVIYLGSFWPNTKSSFESSLVKSFKECVPVSSFEPHISHLCDFYADRIIERLPGERFDWVARVMSSSEKKSENSRPGDRLVEILCARLGASNITPILYKSDSRPSMRSVSRLSGPDALRPRIEYVLQDLFIRPCDLGGRVLLLDDIYNTCASMRVYGAALMKFAGVGEVVGVNLAATRFSRGKDGHGMLKLDVSSIEDSASLRPVFVSDGLYHNSNCPDISTQSSIVPIFTAQKSATPCPRCIEISKSKPWWRIW